MKNTFFGLWILFLGLFIIWCSSQNVWDVEYDLSSEMWRNLHCSAMFQKADVAKLKWTHWIAERILDDNYLVEWKMDTDNWEYYTTCIYPQSDGEWNISISPRDDLLGSINPAVQYCITNWWTYTIMENSTSTYWECWFENWESCNAWEYYYWVCSQESIETWLVTSWDVE